MSLVAATTLGIGTVDHVTARISAARELQPEGDYRLIVQAYRRHQLQGELPGQYSQPLASTQRAVTAEQLRSGVDVSVVQLDASFGDDAVLVAWVERGLPNLELDGLEARPAKAAYYGVAAQADGEVVLSRPAV